MTAATDVYLDASALLKRWLEGAGNAAVARVFHDPHQRFVTSQLTLIEVSSAVSHRMRLAELSPETGDELLRQVFRDMETFVAAGKLQLHPINDEVIAQSVQCLRRCAGLGLALRSLDAIHIATALTVGRQSSVPFLTADKQLFCAVEALGLAGQLI